MDKEIAIEAEYTSELTDRINKFIDETVPNGYFRHKVLIIKILDLE